MFDRNFAVPRRNRSSIISRCRFPPIRHPGTGDSLMFGVGGNSRVRGEPGEGWRSGLSQSQYIAVQEIRILHKMLGRSFCAGAAIDDADIDSSGRRHIISDAFATHIDALIKGLTGCVMSPIVAACMVRGTAPPTIVRLIGKHPALLIELGGGRSLGHLGV